jgi:hypothetical protein
MSTNRRQAHRFPSPPERSEAVLKVGDDSIAVCLLDESATGFALQVDQHPGVYEGEVVWLHEGACWTKVRVVHIHADSAGVQLGVTRVVDTPEVADPAEKPAFRFWRMPKNNRVPVIIALAVLLTLTLVPMLRVWQMGRKASPVGEDEVSNAAAGRGQKEFHAWVRDMGPAVFVAPEIVGVLALSERQIERIQRITHRTQQAVALAKDTGATPLEIRHLRLDAQNEARRVLNASQRAKWEELVRLVEQGVAPGN